MLNSTHNKLLYETKLYFYIELDKMHVLFFHKNMEVFFYFFFYFFFMYLCIKSSIGTQGEVS